MTKWFLGTMGFSYKPWVGPFYPDGLNSRLHLTYYAERFNALELDSTFYGTPRATSAQRWYEVTPPAFVICPKMPRSITHELRLVSAVEATAEFLARMRLLGDKLGPILVQFPPDFSTAEMGALVHFLPTLPRDLRFALEFRHRSWEAPETAVLLEKHNLSLVAADYIHLARRIVVTTDFLYLRFLGEHGRFPDKDREVVDRSDDLQLWWQNLQPRLPEVKAVYAFFNDDFAGFAPSTCNRFKKVIGLDPGEIRPMQQGRLF